MSRIRPNIARLADWHRIKGIYGINRRVSAIVVRHVGLGALCRVGGERAPAILRNREMSWNPSDQRHDFLQEGASFDAVVIGHDDERRELILSKKAADPDPLDQFLVAHRDGSEVEGRVFRILSSGDLVIALEGGVEGLAPQHTIPRPKANEELTAAWTIKVGDWVRAKVTGVERPAGRVRLNVEAARQAAERVAEVRVREIEQFSPVQRTAPAVTAPPTSPPPPEALDVLLVENDPDISEPLAFYLRTRGHRVHHARTRADAEKALAELTGLDVAVIDLQLSGDHGGDVLRKARERFPRARLYLFTGNPAAVYYPQNALADRTVFKPIANHALVALVEGRSVEAMVVRPASLDEGITEFLGSNPTDLGSLTARDLVDAHLRSVQEVYPRATVALLGHDAEVSAIRCLRVQGGSAEPFARFAQPLFASPIADVLVDGIPVRINLNRMANPSASFRGFMSALRASYLIGLPVPAESAPLPLGMFLFLPDVPEGSPEAMTRLHVRVDALGVALDRAVLDAQLLQNQRAMCAGGLFLALTHELSNSIHAVLGQLSLLRDYVTGEQATQVPEANKLKVIDRMTARVTGLMTTFDELLGTVKPRANAAVVPLTEVLGQVVDATRTTADHHNVRLFVPDLVDPRVRGLPVPAVFRQALFNLVLNAIQHTGAYRMANELQNGLVTVTAEYETAEDGEWVVIRIRDNGPGVDGTATDRVFDMYHTTRKRGSGLGLYVTRNIVESCRGRVEVERTVKFVETTFAVRLPARTDRGGQA
jgi:signal transduction histidine kinase